MSARRRRRLVGLAIAMAAVVGGLVFGAMGVASAMEPDGAVTEVTTQIIDWE